jgi:hypothetical protein
MSEHLYAVRTSPFVPFAAYLTQAALYGAFLAALLPSTCTIAVIVGFKQVPAAYAQQA